MTEKIAVDLTDFGLWMTDPHPVLRELREHDPVHWHEAVAGNPLASHPFWALTRHEDVRFVSRNPEMFSSADGVAASTLRIGLSEDHDTFAMVQADDPLHAWMRAVASRAFTARMVVQSETGIRELTGAILDDLHERRHDEIDFVHEVSSPIPVGVIGSILGVPREDFHLLMEWTDAVSDVADLEVDLANGTGHSATAKAAVEEMFGYLARMQDLRAADPDPPDDLVTRMMNVEVRGEGMSLQQQREAFFVLVTAGNDTTRNTISCGVKALAEHPGQRAELVADPELIPGAVEEMLRWGSVVTHFRRTATRDVRIGDKDIKAGDWVVIFYPAANRDPAVFADPYRFDVHRSPNDHFAFGGGGAHFCLGAPLARLEMRVVFEELLRRYPNYRVTGESPYAASNIFHGYRSMPVVLQPR